MKEQKKKKNQKSESLLIIAYIWKKLGEGGANKVFWPAIAYVQIRENTESHQEKCKVSESNSPGQGPSVSSVFVQNQARWGLC